ncbi:MAG: GGDEF domain-containing protein [Treponema sp.]|uniref:GGDEF domain-containing protein n=1 Tax=Treponema sp. TaxID=166 RepID=UPI002A912BFE|nr:GGDEF domain-containing protein [Treponema sp.]MDY6398801.1 GGDEF domain-containing protein [Treponema sp.]
MISQYRKHNFYLLVYLLIFVLWLGSVLIKAARADGNQIIFEEGEYFDCSEGWYDDEGNVFNIEKLVFTKSDVLKEKIIHYRIPEECKLKGGEAICFFSRGIDFTVWANAPEDNPYSSSKELGSRTIYEFKQNAAYLSGKDIGLTVQIVPINTMDKYNEISIAITPREYSAFILEMRIEKASDYIFSTIRSRMPRFLLSIFIIFFGLAIVFYTKFAIDRKREEKTVFYSWGFHSLILGTLLTIESQVIQILTGRPEFINSLKYALALLICFPMAVKVDAITKYPHKRFSHIIGAVVAVLFVIESAGSYFFNVSFYRLFLLSLILLIATGLITIYFVYKEIKNRKKLEHPGISIFINIMSIVNGLVWGIDIAIYVKAARHMTEWGRIMRVFYISYLFVILIYLFRLSIIRNHQAALADKYKIASRTDALTGLLNKGAYMEKESELSAKLMAGQENNEKEFTFALMTLDLNYLKKVNDNLGHDEGDKFIQAAANILKTAVGENGECYRTGGDEFFAILYGQNPEDIYQSVVKDLNKRIDEYNAKENKPIKLSFAYGHSICTSSQNYSIHDSERIADKEMYECKHAMKAER